MPHISRTCQSLTRRRFLGLAIAGLVSIGAAACSPKRIVEQGTSVFDPPPTQSMPSVLAQPSPAPPTAEVSVTTKEPGMPTYQPTTAPPVAARGHLQVRPAAPSQPTTQTGQATLGLVAARDVLIYVPTTYQVEEPAPLVVLLHGAGGSAKHGLALLQPLADDAGLILLALSSRSRTWDVIEREYGPDVALIDQALAQTFARYAVDPAHLAIGGFSDGASYALSLGLTNGDLFSHILAFSPGFMAPSRQQGAPRIYVSHGTRDQVLPIEACSRQIVPRLERAGHDVRYQEFDGQHTVPAEIARAAVQWFGGEG
jgi:phospholipase/carboxylesterase